LAALAVWTTLVLVGAGCGSSNDVTAGTGLGDLVADAADAPASTSTVATVTVAPTTTTVAPDPYETLVATVRPEVLVLPTFSEPDGEPVEFADGLTNPTFFGNDLVLVVTEEADDEWLKVKLPVRPNGTEAWIRAGDVTLSTHRFRAQINVADRSVTVWEGEEVLAETGAVVGKDQTPTPLGSFYINEVVPKWADSVYGPVILSLSGFSEVLDTFGGGVPVIALHGTNHPELIGGAHSNGCIRIPNEVITQLADTLPVGTPVEIVA
jgi:hypothetical protein